MRPWLAALVLARCAGLRPMTNFGSANYGDDDFHFKKRYALIGAAAAATSVRPVRRGARFQAGMLRIGACYAARCVTRQPINEVHEATAIKMERLVRDLRGAYVKSAQLISTAFPELLPAPWVSGWDLVDDAPARPWRVTAVPRELGDVEESFRHLSSSLSVLRRSARSTEPRPSTIVPLP